ncbi:DNA-binding Xre family transcriptional regulator [Kribbella orskensis]|uniref:DNA-binding Xre family transcriptional regulator n=1 Tax=Kribbella orskensis TaxID=2512216 RepID=A0ABY2B9J9_9ACTN|nr:MULTISPECIES: helix-turn-helix transcriptional regulator [Kribbella]TCN32131.1 DNA-binding Xre family transcriptional regulator [Kribbella sp. VKM Ac-2500]TCO12150.1 DNA-binding Xre family transcriptional regulator [Kribbella orskensis]
MNKKMGIEWNLRLRMAERGLFSTTDLVPLLAERGVQLSREQVYRLVTSPPQRLSMDVLAALCDILDCTPNELITVAVVNQTVAKQAHGAGGPDGAAPRPRRTTIRRPDST